MIPQTRRWRCDTCHLIYRANKMPLCGKCGAAMTEIDKDGEPIAKGIVKPALEVVTISPQVNERARRLVFSALGGE